ncbi:MAG: TonB-dependent receptor plug domain-containing protein [Bacteroidetes bacterium]|nr:TonB-dependent receptor plug domain-containing protein [Bacteroidota bacterium]
MKKISLILLWLVIHTSLEAQNSCNLRIGGYLHFSDDSTPVQNAEIFIENYHLKTKTDAFGYFFLKKLCPGSTLLEMDLGDQVHIHYFIDIYVDTQFHIYIERPANALHAANIIAHKKPVSQILSDQILQHSGENLATQMEQLPGVQNLRSGNNTGKPVSEGFSGLRLPIYINGMKLEGQQWGAEHGPEMDILGYQKINILHGASVLTMAHDALGGVVEISGNKEAHAGETDILLGSAFASNGLQSTSFLKATGKSFGTGLTWFGNGSYRRAGNYQSPDYYLLNTGLQEFNVNAGIISEKIAKRQELNISFFQNKSGIFLGSEIGNIADLLNAIQRHNPYYGSGYFDYQIKKPFQSVTHGSMRFEQKTNNRKLQISAQADNRREFDFHRKSSDNFPQLDLYLVSISIQNDLNTTFSKNKHLQWGWNLSPTANRYGGYFFIPDFYSVTGGIYSLYRYNFKKSYFIFSSRADAKYLQAQWNYNGKEYSDQRKFANLAVAAEYNYNKKYSKFQFSIARLWRAPWVNELYSSGVHHGSASFEQGNSQLKTESDYKFQLDYYFDNKKFQIYLKPYFHYLHQFINLTPDSTPVLTVRGAYPSYSYRQFDAIYTGVDGYCQYQPLPHLQLKVKGSFIYGRNVSSHIFPAYIPTPMLAVSGTYGNKYLKFYFENSYHFRQIFYTENSDYLPPPPSFMLLNAGIEFRNFIHQRQFLIYLDCNNILNRSYRNYLDRFRYFADMPGRNIQIRIIYNFHHHNENKNKNHEK